MWHTGDHLTSIPFSMQQGKLRLQFVWALTFLVKTSGQLLPLLKVWAWEHLQHLFDATPPGPGQDLRQSDAEWSVATVHIGDVIGVLGNTHTKKKRLSQF